MVDSALTLPVIWNGLLWPLTRLLLFVSLGMLAGNFIEALNWTHRVAMVVRPLTRLGRLSSTTGASFSMAFFSGVAANTMLSEAYDQRQLAKLELVLANLFNSLPRFFLHLPTVFFLTASLIKGAAFIYVGLTLTAAVVQTGLVVLAGRILLAPQPTGYEPVKPAGNKNITWRQALEKSRRRFQKRIWRIIRFTVPVYVLFFLLNRYGLFDQARNFLAGQVPFLSWLHPQSLGIVALHVTAEFAAGLAAAGALIDASSIGYRDAVLALLAGNVLASPIRAIRHQFPYYAGIFKPRLAVELIVVSQVFRVATIMLVTFIYYFFTA
ncbi:MAG: hypothetical protein L3J03_07830 [Desulfobacterales bacterium]|nr:hypothetical protein [Desulfobacterales bacterium]